MGIKGNQAERDLELQQGMQNLYFELTLPPSVNHRTIPIKRKGHTAQILAPEYRRWKEQAEYTIHSLLAPEYDKRQCEAGVVVTIMFSFPDNRRRDLDNYLKPLLDACTAAGVWRDDCLIRQLVVCRDEPKKRPEVRLYVFPFCRYEAKIKEVKAPPEEVTMQGMFLRAED